MRALSSAFVLAVLLAAPVHAGDGRAAVEPTYDYWNAHRDQKYRRLGIEALQAGRGEEARHLLGQAARYADKPAQALLAQLYWEGQGGPRDPATAYAWMDLAAERGHPQLLLQREYYWSALDEPARARALEVGRALYAEYGDAQAQPRLERERRRWTRLAVGSRLGGPSAARACTGSKAAGRGAGGLDVCGSGVDASVHYAEARLSPAEYWRARDQDVAALFGTAAIGTLEPQR
ncbi:hypothetical protein QF205_07790 [Luteimonas composti]|uniref:Sel1 repeat family protein n=1 Tax=Luteimonas composti TaxID=398257 RepID=A0ABT6MQR0_9GAMM|nr:hypothetical protein [Luteimonas composti]MDH7452977.1 hypothetical protein [Luteimonas composti]